MSSSSSKKTWKAWSALSPFFILAGVLLLFGLLIAWKDLVESRANLGTDAPWLKAWQESEMAGVKAFFSGDNAKIILTQTVIVAIAALGMTLIIISGGIDLSFGSGIALSSVVGALLIKNQAPLPWVILAPILCGACLGTFSGSIVAGFNLTPFIVTLGMLGVGRGLAKWLAGNQTVNFPESPLASLMTASEGLPPGVWLAAGLAVVMSIILKHTIFGRYLFAIGSNEATARLCGIKTRKLKVILYGIAGLFVGLAGLMQMARLQQGDPTAAMGLELDIIAAVVIGGASLSGGTGSILGSMVGALTMASLRTGSQYMDWPNYMQEIIIGVLIILAVGLDRWRMVRGK